MVDGMLETGMLEYYGRTVHILVVASANQCCRNVISLPAWLKQDKLNEKIHLNAGCILPRLDMPTDQLSLRWMGISPGIIDLHGLNQGFWQSKLVLD